MKRLLDSLKIATQHLITLDEVFRQHHPAYNQYNNRLESLPMYDRLRLEIYAGGKKRGKNKYGRQMILGDLLQYIFTGRGYYFAVRGDAEREAFVTILMYVCNQLIIMEDVSVLTNLRVRMLNKLKSIIGVPFFEEKSQETKFEELKQYTGKIIPPGEGKQFDNTLDSMLPKRVGIVPELLIYSHFIRKNYGYLVSLLHEQRLLGNNGYIVPPDFLLLSVVNQRNGTLFKPNTLA